METSTRPKSVFITGATSGFGEAMAWKFAAHGWDITLTGRRGERLDDLRDAMLEKYPSLTVWLLSFDVRNRRQTEEALNGWVTWEKGLDLLINNAGLAAGLATIDEGEPDDWEQMIDTNLKGLLYVTKALLPALGRGGHIINIGSTAAKTAYKNGAVYSATKAAVDALTRGMRIDLLPKGIKVTAVHPGAAETEFSLVRFRGDAERAAAVYEGFQPLSAGDVADVVYYCATLPPHVCINDLTVTALAQADSTHILRS